MSLNYCLLVEKKTNQGQKLLAPIDTIVKKSRDILKAVYREEPKKLGEFGFDVADSPKVSKPKAAKTDTGATV